MDRRRFVLAVPAMMLCGCRGRQYGHIVQEDQQDLVGSHEAGAATFNPLIEEAVAKLLGRQEMAVHEISYQPEVTWPRRVCFVGIENQSAEELGDFREQIYEQIDAQVNQSPHFQMISRRFVEAALRETRLRPDSLFLPDNMQLFAGMLHQQGHPMDYLLFGKLTSGTTERNHDYQRDYLLTLELINIHTGQYDKEAAKIRKGYHHTRIGKWRQYNPFTRQ